MTLIAQTIHHRVPFLIGDILFTSDEGNNKMPFPTSLSNIDQFVQKLNSKPEFYFQKIYILTPNICIGMAGDSVEMTNLLKELRIKIRYYEKFTLELLISIFDSCDLEQTFRESAFIACLMEHDHSGFSARTVTYPENAFQRASSTAFENITAVGTGAEQFCFQAKDLGKLILNGAEGSLQRAISANVAYIAKLLAIEVSSLITLRDAWGAGFEVIYYTESGFKKLDDVAFVVFKSQFDYKNIGDPEPILVLHYRYYANILIYSCLKINRFDMEESELSVKFTSSHITANIYIVPELDTHLPVKEKPTDYSFSTDKVGFGYAFITPSNGIYSPSSFLEGGLINVTFKHGKSVEITVDKGYLGLLRTSITIATAKMQ